MVLGKQHIQTVEGERVAPVGSWQKYVPLTAEMPVSLIASWCISWFGEKYTSVRTIYITGVRDFYIAD